MIQSQRLRKSPVQLLALAVNPNQGDYRVGKQFSKCILATNMYPPHLCVGWPDPLDEGLKHLFTGNRGANI